MEVLLREETQQAEQSRQRVTEQGNGLARRQALLGGYIT